MNLNIFSYAKILYKKIINEVLKARRDVSLFPFSFFPFSFQKFHFSFIEEDLGCY